MQVRFLPRAPELFSREEFGDLGLAAGCRVFSHKSALGGLVDSLVDQRYRRDVALFSGAGALHRRADGLFARVIKDLLAEACAMRFLGGLCNCHSKRLAQQVPQVQLTMKTGQSYRTGCPSCIYCSSI